MGNSSATPGDENEWGIQHALGEWSMLSERGDFPVGLRDFQVRQSPLFTLFCREAGEACLSGLHAPRCLTGRSNLLCSTCCLRDLPFRYPDKFAASHVRASFPGPADHAGDRYDRVADVAGRRLDPARRLRSNDQPRLRGSLLGIAERRHHVHGAVDRRRGPLSGALDQGHQPQPAAIELHRQRHPRTEIPDRLDEAVFANAQPARREPAATSRILSLYARRRRAARSSDQPNAPLIFRVDADDLSPAAAVGDAITFTNSGNSKEVDVIFIGFSRISADPIFRFVAFDAGGLSLAEIFDGTTVTASAGFADTTNKAELVSALEDHISGFSGAGDTDSDDFKDNFATDPSGPMKREIGEETPYRDMGLKTFTNFVEAETFQVSARVTTEQIQDLNKQFGIDVVSMVENALVNEVSQSINRDILRSVFDLGALNKARFAVAEGVDLDLDLTSLSVTFENQMTLQRRIYSRLLLAANMVANRGRRGPANYIVCGAQIASALQDISQFVTAPFANTFSQNNGSLYPVGGIAGMTVYVDQYMKFGDTRINVGRKGADDEPGLKFMPYLMAESIQTISEGTMSPKIAVKSRYALIEAGFHPETMYATFDVTLPAEGIA